MLTSNKIDSREPGKKGLEERAMDGLLLIHHAPALQKSSTGGVYFTLRDLDMQVQGLSENNPSST